MQTSFAKFLAGLLFILYPFSVFAAQSVNPAFNPNLLIPDGVFSDTKTFGGHSAIQKFLEEKGSALADTSTEFLLKLHEPDDSLLKERLGDPNFNLGRPRTAAELIWDASQASGLNPQVILVTLNKEQGLITSKIAPDRLQRALNFAMGFACPDDGGCDDSVSGFYFQLFGNFNSDDDRYIGAPKSLMKSFRTPNGRGPYKDGQITHVGDTVTFENTLGGFEGVEPQQTVTLGNLATTALYRYTPHVFNGNYNFWRFFTSWFKYPNTTVLKAIEDGTYYILKKGERRRLPVFVAKTRNINLKHAVGVSSTELNNYPLGAIYKPADNTVVSADSRIYLFIEGVRYPVSRLALTQKKLGFSKVVKISQTESALFAEGSQILPEDGTILRASGGTKFYLVQNGALKLFGRFTLNQYKARQKAHVVSADELAGYPKEGYVAPRNNTLVRSKNDAGAIFIMKNGEKKPLPRRLFLNLRYKMNDVVKLSDAEMKSFPIGTHPTPRNNTYFKVTETGEMFLFKNGAVHAIKKKIKFNYKFPADVVKDWKVGEPVK